MENFTPSSEEKESMGDRVPEVNTMLCTDPLRSEKALEVQTQREIMYATAKTPDVMD